MYFRDIVGHSDLKKSLTQIVKDDHVSHALMFAGREGSGNLALAIAFSAYLLCKNRGPDERCGECLNCKQLDQLGHPDMHFSFPFIKKTDKIKVTDIYQLDFKKAVKKNPYLSLKDWEIQIAGENKQSIITVDESAQIVKKLSLKSFAGGYKIMIIWMPEKLNQQAENKLLKTLEEPSPRTVILLVPAKAEDLLPTIISRVQMVKCRPLRDQEVRSGLIEKLGVSPEVAEKAAHVAEGNFNLALKTAQNPDSESVYFELFRDWMRTCVSPKNHDIVEVTEKIAALSRDQQGYFLDYCLSFLHEAVVYAYLGKEKARYIGASAEFAEKFAPYMADKDLGAFHDTLSKGHRLVERNVNPRLLYMKLSAEMIRIFMGKRPEPIS
jgi:DNA polymerase-3 subunit delta'